MGQARLSTEVRKVGIRLCPDSQDLPLFYESGPWGAMSAGDLVNTRGGRDGVMD